MILRVAMSSHGMKFVNSDVVMHVAADHWTYDATCLCKNGEDDEATTIEYWVPSYTMGEVSNPRDGYIDLEY